MLRKGDGNLKLFDNLSTDACLELFIYPFSEESSIDAGAFLIAEPRLRFFKNEYTD